MAKDPICGMEVKPENAPATTKYKEQNYYFCAERCKEEFEKDPEKYLKTGDGSSCCCGN